jgi:fermentation-respiration switch protein FrsA (DUF1100 family)
VNGVPGVFGYIGWPLLAASGYGALWWFANRAAYYPFKYPQGLWDLQPQLHAEDVWLHTPDGVRLHAWWVRQEGARLATLYLHGNAGNVTHRYRQIREITAAGSSILMLDYRSYGKSGGRPTEKGLYADAETAYRHLLETGYRAGQIVLHGESLGTAVALDVASRNPCAAVVLEAPFTSARDVARTVLPLLGPLLIWSFDSVKKIGRIRAPLLFVQGDRDEIIPLRLGQNLFAAAPEPKSFWIVEGAGHNDLPEMAGERYRQRLQSFYQRLPAEPLIPSR